MRPTLPLALLSAALLLPACAADREMDNLLATVPVALNTGSAHDLATWVLKDLDAATTIPDADKTDMRARAQILDAHSLSVATALRLYDPAGKENPSITLNNLNARSDALVAEYRATFREWGVWQVSHARKKPSEIPEIFDYVEALKDDTSTTR